MSSKYDKDNLLETYELEELAKKLRPLMGKTFWYLVNVYWNHWDKEHANAKKYADFLDAALKPLLLAYGDYDRIWKAYDEVRATAASTALIRDLYEAARGYLRDNGVII